MKKQCDSEKEFLENYNSNKYKKPSVTADIVVLTINDNNDLNILLIKRRAHPYKDYWAIPGGFLNVDKESIDETAKRELSEETGITNADLRQLYTFGSPDRDPRMHVVSVAYTALVPKNKLKFSAGDDAGDAKLFKIVSKCKDKLFFVNTDESIAFSEDELAFDHAKVINMAIKRLRGRIDYEPDAFSLLEDTRDFTIYELKRIYESIKNTTIDKSNFRKMFIRDYVDTGKVIQNKRNHGTEKKPIASYRIVKSKLYKD